MAVSEGSSIATGVIAEKEVLRKQVRDQYMQREPEWVQQMSIPIQEHLMAQETFAAARTIACYLAMPREVQTDYIIECCPERNKRLCVPAYRPENRRYSLSWISTDSPMQEGPDGVMEPAQPDWVTSELIHVIIVPGLAFDPRGARLGHGGGHYDRMLRQFKGMRIGLAFQFQIMDALPTTEHDAFVDFVITEESIYFNGTRHSLK